MTLSTKPLRSATHAMVRPVGRRFLDAQVLEQPAQPIDLPRAMGQHAAYVDAIRASGLRVIELAEADAHPDGCFVEDQAVILDGVALITRSGCRARRSEARSVAEALTGHLDVVHMQGPATLDGGDVLDVGEHLFVGLSSRTNEAGVRALRDVAVGRVVHAVPVGGLHLKCVVSPVGPGRVLWATGVVDIPALREVAAVLEVHDVDAYAANCLTLPDRVLVAAGYPRVTQTLTAAGLAVHEVDTSEIAKADGSLTCMSVLF